jgi:putative colanic acid biosynthesis glycosyltransferase WcaI
MDVIIHDYAGHPFQLQLSRELARRGNCVTHQYCASYTTGKGAVVRTADDPDSFSVESFSMTGEFARYSPIRRVIQELHYGAVVGKRLRTSGARLVVMCNIPLLAHAVAAAILRLSRMPMIFWQQDVYSDAIGTAARRRLGQYGGGAVAWIADRLECFVSRTSAHIVAISESFEEVLGRWGVPPERVTIIPNWAALPELPACPRDNEWARSHDLVNREVVLYSGTLGIKHNPRIFIDLAKALELSKPNARVVVISEGQGRAFLESERRGLHLDNLVLLDYQPYEALPRVLASADVLIAVLEPDAGRYSVPSKVLNYLCAARPILAVIPAENDVATILRSSGAGIAVDPGKHQHAIAELMILLAQPDTRIRLGTAGRQYAEATFDISEIGGRFESVLRKVNGTRHTSDRAQPAKTNRGGT